MSDPGNDPAATLLAGAVHAYRWTLKPLLGTQCRFEPSCSAYALDALRVHGAGRGAALAARRILRCNPWHPGGADPVPLPPRAS
jgi:putative membrane protein insertion efficiency factor